MSDELTQLRARDAIAKMAREEHFSGEDLSRFWTWENMVPEHRERWLAFADRVIAALGDADTKPLEPIRFRVSIGVHHAEIQVPPHAPEAYHQGMIQTAIAEVLRRAGRKTQADRADVDLVDRVVSGAFRDPQYFAAVRFAWSRIRQALLPHGDADKFTIPDSTKKEGEK